MEEFEEQQGRRKRKSRSKPKLETEQQAYDYALNLLSYRDHSQKEMRQKLTRKGVSEEQIQSSLDKLTEYGLMNEERFAQRVYEGWLAKRVYGRQHLVAELQKKGVPKAYISEILSQFTDAREQERAQAASEQFCKANRKKIANGLHSEDSKAKQKLYAMAARYLAARGFSSKYLELLWEQIKSSLD